MKIVASSKIVKKKIMTMKVAVAAVNKENYEISKYFKIITWLFSRVHTGF